MKKILGTDVIANVNFERLVIIWRKLKSFFGFGGKERSPFFVFKIKAPIESVEKLYEAFCDLHYQYNIFSFVEKEQILNVRKVYGKRQIHFRVFKDGEVRAHDELNYEFFPLEHYRGETFRNVDMKEINLVKTKLKNL